MGALTARFARWLGQRLCALTGHAYVTTFDREQERRVDVCGNCGHATAGWDRGTARPRPRFVGDSRRLQIQPMRERFRRRLREQKRRAS